MSDPTTAESNPKVVLGQIKAKITDLSEPSIEKLVAAFAEHGWQSITDADIAAKGYPPYPQLAAVADYVNKLWADERPFSATVIDEKTRRHLMARFTEVGLSNDDRHDLIFKVTGGATSSSKELTEQQGFEVLEALEDLELERRDAHSRRSSGSGSVVSDAPTSGALESEEPEPPSVSYISVSWSDGFTIDLTLAEMYAYLTELRSRYVK